MFLNTEGCALMFSKPEQGEIKAKCNEMTSLASCSLLGSVLTARPAEPWAGGRVGPGSPQGGQSHFHRDPNASSVFSDHVGVCRRGGNEATRGGRFGGAVGWFRGDETRLCISAPAPPRAPRPWVTSAGREAHPRSAHRGPRTQCRHSRVETRVTCWTPAVRGGPQRPESPRSRRLPSHGLCQPPRSVGHTRLRPEAFSGPQAGSLLPLLLPVAHVSPARSAA